MCDLGTIFPYSFDSMATCFYKATEQNGPLLLKGEPIVRSSESREEQIGPLSVICNQFVSCRAFFLTRELPKGFIVSFCNKRNVCSILNVFV